MWETSGGEQYKISVFCLSVVDEIALIGPHAEFWGPLDTRRRAAAVDLTLDQTDSYSSCIPP